jgi:hypothetical protein
MQISSFPVKLINVFTFFNQFNVKKQLKKEVSDQGIENPRVLGSIPSPGTII